LFEANLLSDLYRPKYLRSRREVDITLHIKLEEPFSAIFPLLGCGWRCLLG